MVISEEDKIIIQNDVEEKNWTAYTIWREHPSKKWDRVSVWRVVKKLKETGTIKRRKGSGRPVTATTDQHQAYVDDAIFSERVECSFSCDANFRYNRDIIMVIEQFSNFNFENIVFHSHWYDN